MKVIGTKSGEFKLKKIDTHINNHKILTDVCLKKLKDLDLDMFPIVNDIEVLITKKKLKRTGKHISLYSARRNEQLTTFPKWACAELFLEDWDSSTIPTGTIDQPFYDIMEGWQIIIFEEKEFIYLLEGGESEEKINTIHTWYRTPKSLYFKEWKKLIKKYKGKKIKVIGTKSGEFYFKDINENIHINDHKSLILTPTNTYMHNLNLSLFPVVNDFEILINKKRLRTLGKHIYFYSASRNEKLTSFPWWDNAEIFLKKWRKKDMPIGTIDNPFSDLEKGWQVFIFEENGFVYILQGDEIKNENNEMHTWYKTPKALYFKEWKKLLKRFK